MGHKAKEKQEKPTSELSESFETLNRVVLRRELISCREILLVGLRKRRKASASPTEQET